jgi:hypothetical protein
MSAAAKAMRARIVLKGAVRLVRTAGALGLPIDTIRTCNIELDSTVFGSAPNKPNPTDILVGAVFSADAPRP